MKLTRVLAAATIASFGAGAAFSSTIHVEVFDADAYNDALDTFQTVVIEDFEGETERNVPGIVGDAGPGYDTGTVGVFRSLGGSGSGGTVFGGGSFAGNDGNLLAIRDGNVFGRTSTTSLVNPLSDGAGMFLDSNDTWGIQWTASMGGSAFNQLLLTLSDATDISGTIMNITSPDGGTATLQDLGNGDRRTILIKFDTAVTSAVIEFENTKNRKRRINDGFSLDDIAVGNTAVVPLPASVLLLLGGLGGLGAMRRLKKS